LHLGLRDHLIYVGILFICAELAKKFITKKESEKRTNDVHPKLLKKYDMELKSCGLRAPVAYWYRDVDAKVPASYR